MVHLLNRILCSHKKYIMKKLHRLIWEDIQEDIIQWKKQNQGIAHVMDSMIQYV